MKYLLDTHTLIWFCEDDPKLPGHVKLLIEDFENDFFVSIATLWEMSIKISLGKLQINRDFVEIIKLIFSNGFKFLPISYRHTNELISLPFIHKDPFDRMLITQTKFEEMIIISNEKIFDDYGIHRYW